MITVAAVLKTGGPDYDTSYVRRLAAGIRKHLTVPFEFVCLSDRASDVERDCGALVDSTVWLDHREWPGWWSKLEVFRLSGPVLYFDLDAVMVGDLNPLAERVQSLGADELLMAADWYNGRGESNILGWSGDMAPVYCAFAKDYAPEANWSPGRIGHGMAVANLRFRGDGEWIRRHADAEKITVLMAQKLVPGLVSYKVHVRGRPLSGRGALPDGTVSVQFHGHPRPHQISTRPEWMLQNGWELP